jgi:hypothetical protein
MQMHSAQESLEGTFCFKVYCNNFSYNWLSNSNIMHVTHKFDNIKHSNKHAIDPRFIWIGINTVSKSTAFADIHLWRWTRNAFGRSVLHGCPLRMHPKLTISFIYTIPDCLGPSRYFATLEIYLSPVTSKCATRSVVRRSLLPTV